MATVPILTFNSPKRTAAGAGDDATLGAQGDAPDTCTFPPLGTASAGPTEYTSVIQRYQSSVWDGASPRTATWYAGAIGISGMVANDTSAFGLSTSSDIISEAFLYVAENVTLGGYVAAGFGVGGSEIAFDGDGNIILDCGSGSSIALADDGSISISETGGSSIQMSAGEVTIATKDSGDTNLNLQVRGDLEIQGSGASANPFVAIQNTGVSFGKATESGSGSIAVYDSGGTNNVFHIDSTSNYDVTVGADAQGTKATLTVKGSITAEGGLYVEDTFRVLDADDTANYLEIDSSVTEVATLRAVDGGTGSYDMIEFFYPSGGQFIRFPKIGTSTGTTEEYTSRPLQFEASVWTGAAEREARWAVETMGLFAFVGQDNWSGWAVFAPDGNVVFAGLENAGSIVSAIVEAPTVSITADDINLDGDVQVGDGFGIYMGNGGGDAAGDFIVADGSLIVFEIDAGTNYDVTVGNRSQSTPATLLIDGGDFKISDASDKKLVNIDNDNHMFQVGDSTVDTDLFIYGDVRPLVNDTNNCGDENYRWLGIQGKNIAAGRSGSGGSRVAGYLRVYDSVDPANQDWFTADPANDRFWVEEDVVVWPDAAPTVGTTTRDSKKLAMQSMYYSGGALSAEEVSLRVVQLSVGNQNNELRLRFGTTDELFFDRSGMYPSTDGGSALGTSGNAWAGIRTKGMVSEGDIEVLGSSNGLILESPDNTRWRVTIDNSGNLQTATV